MYQATISYGYHDSVTLGPTDSRDEAARLARTWVEAWGRTAVAAAARNAYELPVVRIERTKED